jgi:xylulose-5-phosphate/fructose-6-phosphate phosphoketolase
MHQVADKPLTADEAEDQDAYWRATNYLSVGQIYLLRNALLTEPLQPADVKPRLLGHWGTTPGLNIIYAHLNLVIRRRDLNMMDVIGPGHGGPAIATNTWLEGSYTDTYPDVTRDLHGMNHLFRQFSFPGGIPNHVAPELPGSIHEGGELGYSLSHAYSAVLDNPDLLVACVIGDGEAETGPLAASWHSNKFIDPCTDGAVLPILHLDGYKIANPAILARIGDEEVTSLLEGYGYRPYLVEGYDPDPAHQTLAATLDVVLDEIADIQAEARSKAGAARRPWPMIFLRTPKGWTGPREVDGVPVEGTWRAHQVPLSGVRTSSKHLAMLEQWLRSYRPGELFDVEGRPVPGLLAQIPSGNQRMGANPHANGGLLTRDLELPDQRD